MYMAWEPDCRPIFFGPPVHLCAVTYYIWNIADCDLEQYRETFYKSILAKLVDLKDSQTIMVVVARGREGFHRFYRRAGFRTIKKDIKQIASVVDFGSISKSKLLRVILSKDQTNLGKVGN